MEKELKEGVVVTSLGEGSKLVRTTDGELETIGEVLYSDESFEFDCFEID